MKFMAQEGNIVRFKDLGKNSQNFADKAFVFMVEDNLFLANQCYRLLFATYMLS